MRGTVCRGKGGPGGGEADETEVVFFELLITAFKVDPASCPSFSVWLIKIHTLIKDLGVSSPRTLTECFLNSR